MIRTASLFILICFSSCHLFSKFRESRFTWSANGSPQSVKLVVPKGYKRSETKKDSLGNEELYYYYPNGSYLYFVNSPDTSKIYQPIVYGENISRELYHATFFKGIDSDNRYWRETRFLHFKAGYRNVQSGYDWLFDSSLNYFALHFSN